jgi:hypothetical protein
MHDKHKRAKEDKFFLIEIPLNRDVDRAEIVY